MICFTNQNSSVEGVTRDGQWNNGSPDSGPVAFQLLACCNNSSSVSLGWLEMNRLLLQATVELFR